MTFTRRGLVLVLAILGLGLSLSACRARGPTAAPSSTTEAALPFPYIWHQPTPWNGRCIIFVHGRGGHKERWLADMRAFERHGFCTFALDLPHHGERRARPGPLSAREQYEAVQQGAEDIIQAAQWLRAQGAREVYLVARSLGSIAGAVALGRGAAIERAELLLAGADLPSILEAQGRAPGPRQRAALRAIDPLTYLPRYTGRLHVHCAREDRTIPPHACQAAYEAATRAQERRLIWHPGGHAMPLTAYFDDALAFFSEGLPRTPTP